MTRLEVMKANQKVYAEAEKKIAGMDDGLEKEVASRYVLAWIKGTKWMGGMSDSKYQKILDKIVSLGYDEHDVMEEMDRQVEYYSDNWDELEAM